MAPIQSCSPVTPPTSVRSLGWPSPRTPTPAPAAPLPPASPWSRPTTDARTALALPPPLPPGPGPTPSREPRPHARPAARLPVLLLTNAELDAADGRHR